MSLQILYLPTSLVEHFRSFSSSAATSLYCLGYLLLQGYDLRVDWILRHPQGHAFYFVARVASLAIFAVALGAETITKRGLLSERNKVRSDTSVVPSES